MRRFVLPITTVVALVAGVVLGWSFKPSARQVAPPQLVVAAPASTTVQLLDQEGFQLNPTTHAYNDARWNNDELNPAFRGLSAGDFEVIQLGWR